MRPDDLIAAWINGYVRRRVSGATDAQAVQPFPAAALGMLGEALVAGAVRELGWPTLRNVVLGARNTSTEVDLLVRAPTSIVVLEVKTWSGFVEGSTDTEHWIRQGAGDREAIVPNAVRQNAAHVAIVERAIGNREVRVFGLVVSAGHARYAERLRSYIVPLVQLPNVLQVQAMKMRPCPSSSLDRAWSLLTREAERSAPRREAHSARVRSRRSHQTNCE